MQRPWGRIVRDTFYTKVEGTEDQWKCQCGLVRRQKGTGYSNLTSHVLNKHPDDLEKLSTEPSDLSFTSEIASTPGNLFHSKKAVQDHGWIDLAVNALLPFSIATNPVYRKHVRYEPITRPSFSKYMEKLTVLVESKIADKLPLQFAVVFDGWSAGDTHYIACNASYPDSNCDGYSMSLLGFSPFGDEISQDADHHYAYLEFVLSLFGKSFTNVVALIGDNCSCNRSLANKVGCALLGCASHRFNLCVKDFIKDSSAVIEKVHDLVKKLRYPIPAAKLRKLTHLRAKCQNSTRWSSTAQMICRYFEIKDYVAELDIEEATDLLLTPRDHKRLDQLRDNFKDFDSVTKSLQRSNVTCAEVRVLFDGIIAVYSGTNDRLSSNATIVNNPDFESGLVKIQNAMVKDLTLAERSATDCLRKSTDSVVEVTDTESLSFADRLLKRRKVDTIHGDYIDTRFLVPTSNACERLFSKSGYALSSRRKNISPASFEQQIFLHANADLWSIVDVSNIID